MLENFSTRFIVKPSNEDEAFSQNASLKDILFIADKRKPTEDDKTAFVFFKSSVKNMESYRVSEIVKELNEQYSLLNINETKSTKDYTIKIINTTKLLDYSSNFMPLFTKSPLVEEFVKRIIEIGKPVFRKMAKADTKELYKTQKKEGYTQLFAITNPSDKSRTTKAHLILNKRQKDSIEIGRAHV